MRPHAAPIACAMNCRRRDTVTEAIYDAGFNSNGRFYAKSAEVLGMAPDEISRRRCGRIDPLRRRGMFARLDPRRSHGKGICAIALGDDPDMLLHDLQDRFPKAQLVGGEAGFEKLVARVVGFVEAPALGLDLPLDVRGTAFQQRVWQALREIPAGRLRVTRRSPSASARRSPFAPWRRRARRTQSPLPFPAIA